MHVARIYLGIRLPIASCGKGTFNGVGVVTSSLKRQWVWQEEQPFHAALQQHTLLAFNGMSSGLSKNF